MGVGAAIIGSTALSVGANIYGAGKQASAARQGAAASEAQYQQTREDLAPWRAVGAAANYELGALAGLPVDYPGQTQPDGQSNQLGGQTRPGGDLMDTPMRITDPRYLNGEQILYGDPRYGDADPFRAVSPVIDQAGQDITAQFGRNGDTAMAHVTPGEIVVPREVAQQPRVQNQLHQGFQDAGMNPDRYVVGSNQNRINPRTRRSEYFAEDDLGGGITGGTKRDLGEGHDRGMRYPPRQRNPRQQQQQPAASGLPDDYYDQGSAVDRFYESPEYTVPFDEGIRAMDASAASRGGLFSGNQMSAITRYGQDYASNQYNNYWNHLYGLSGTGANAAGMTGNIGMKAAEQQGKYYGQQGAAYANRGAGINNAVVGGVGNYLYYQGMQ